ncbi:MAG: HipA domain-containing protein [Pseudodesulfovibrio sp.]|nr:HipA domain-containing protein [Pseudodesulfovibrio sp.]
MSNRCPITFEPCGDVSYSMEGLKRLSPKLKDFKDLELTADQLRAEAATRPVRLSISGVQPKLSARLSIKNETFEITTKGGHFILKPEMWGEFLETPQNEALTMRMASVCGIDVPLHGMVYAADQSFVYFVKRFDRTGKKKLHVEDFSQLLGLGREDKYNVSLERAISALDHCSFPFMEKQAFYRRVVFNYLVGNEDAHLKNWSLITDAEGVVRLSPAYDLMNSAIVTNSGEETALTLNARKNRIRLDDLTRYLGEERLGLSPKVISEVLIQIDQAISTWHTMVEHSFLSDTMKKSYREYLDSKVAVLLAGP